MLIIDYMITIANNFYDISYLLYLYMNPLEIEKKLSLLKNNWKRVNDKIQINIEFSNFNSAFDFMKVIAKECDLLNHHLGSKICVSLSRARTHARSSLARTGRVSSAIPCSLRAKLLLPAVSSRFTSIVLALPDRADSSNLATPLDPMFLPRFVEISEALIPRKFWNH